MFGVGGQKQNLFIMKKMFTASLAFCLGLFISISIIACADDFAGEGNQENKGELQTLSEMVAKLSEDVAKLKVTTEEQAQRIAILEKGDVLTEYSAGNSCRVTFKYDDKGRVSSFHQKTDYEEGNFDCTVSYTDTGCVISHSGGFSIKLTTTGNNSNIINKLIWGAIGYDLD